MQQKPLVEPGSPDWLVATLAHRSRCVREELARLFTGRHGAPALAFLSILLGASLLALRAAILDRFPPANTIVPYFLAYALPILISVLLFPVALFTRAAGARLLVFALSLAFLFALGPSAQRLPLLAAITISFLLPLLGFALSVRIRRELRLIPVLLCTLLASAALAVLRIRLAGNWSFLSYVLFSLPLMPLSFLAMEAGLSEQAFRPWSLSFFSYYFSSINLNYFLAVRSDDLHEPADRRAVFLSGLLNALSGPALVVAAAPLAPGGPWNPKGLTNYPFIFLATWGVLRTAVAIGQLLGYALSSPFHFPLLAADPLVHWRRWNTYFYRWFLAFLFFPVVRRLNSPLLALLLIFVMNFYLHEAQTLFIPLFLDAPSPVLRGLLTRSFCFYFAHATLIYLCIKTQGFWPSGASRRGWLGVVATNFAMELIHLILR